MHKLLVYQLILVCIFAVGCSAPDDSENGPIRVHNIAKRTMASDGTFDIVHRVRTKGVGSSLGKVFDDLNDVQLSAAKKLGINPVYSLQDIYDIKRPLVKIETCNDFYLDSLTHSMPYLVPEAAKLIHDIGRAFTDTVIARGGQKCQIKVTSVLRTESTVKKLRRRNSNASASSCHMYGTTFDISWSKFVYCDPNYIMYTEDLKNILGEVLLEMRNQGRCYVKYERKQSCFHITTRK